MATWAGGIAFESGKVLKGLNLTSDSATRSISLEEGSSLPFLSVVETDRVPLCLIAGAPFAVTISDADTRDYIHSVVVSDDHDSKQTASSQQWWHTARDSNLGILVSCNTSKTRQGTPSLTELLIYATRGDGGRSHRHPTPPSSSPPPSTSRITSGQAEIKLLALPLCSYLLNSANAEPTPPSSPTSEARFLPISHSVNEGEHINIPPTRKRRSVNDAFDEASERRLKARRMAGESVAAAAASQSQSQSQADILAANLKRHRRTVSGGHSVPLQTRPLSRASSVVSASHSNTRETSVPAPAPTKRSSLSRVKSISALHPHDPPSDESSSTESKNKELISRTVMACMRLYGYTQSKSRKSRTSSDFADDLRDAGDEEYKLLYHQVYKGVCFAFRSHIATTSLTAHADALRDATDRLLGMFCNEPLAAGALSQDDKLTPGGRKAFGSAQLQHDLAGDAHNPFVVAGVSSAAATPSTRPR